MAHSREENGDVPDPADIESEVATPQSLMSRVSTLNSFMDAAEPGVTAEHQLTIRAALPLYVKAILWSVLLSLTIAMEGYDLGIINGFYALPQFQSEYGKPVAGSVSSEPYQVPTAWQSALTTAPIVGEIVGLLFNGFLTERFGYRYTLVGALVWLCVFIFLAFFANTVGLLLASEVLCGISWGAFQTLSTTYASEIMPVALRAYLTSNVNFCWLLGQLTGTGVQRGIIYIQSEWSYRIPFALQWVWAVFILAGVLLAPESPWWLLRKGYYDRAKASLLRLTRKGMASFNADETISLMKRTNDLEKSLRAGNSYWDCFMGVNLRRTEICCMVWATQTLCGAPMTAYATYFYNQTGIDAVRSFDLSLGMYGLGIVGAMISWFLMPVVGRRTLYLWGLAILFLLLLVAGSVGTQDRSVGTQDTTLWVPWTLGSLVILHTFVYDITIGPVCYSLVAEIPSTRLKVKTVVLARIAYNITTILSSVLMPEMVDQTAWNWKGKTCFFWAGTCLLCYVWCYYRLPEPKGLTYLELDFLFEKRITAREFRSVPNILEEVTHLQTGNG